VWQNKYPRKIFAVFSSRFTLWISKRNFINTFIQPMHTMYFKVIRITVTSPSDFSVLKNFHREMHSWISCAEQDVKQLSGFHCQEWLNMPANFILKFQATDEKTAKKIFRGILFATPVCYTNSSLVLADIYTYISLCFTQSNSPTHTKSLFSFRTHASREFLNSVSASSCKVMASSSDRYAQSLCRYWSVWISNFPLWRKC